MLTPYNRLFYILNALTAFGPKFDYPTAHLPEGFRVRPNIRQSRSGFRDDLLSSGDRPLPFVSTDVGSFEGYFMKVISGREIYAFEGIPFAEIPIRFSHPIPKKPFQGNFSAKSSGHACPQTYIGTMIKGRWIFGNEDCLTCDVYSPEISYKGREPNLPVIFNIYGGGFETGGGRDYGPAYLLEQDVILVNCNYRVGALGFLSTFDDVAPGNWGLKDLVLALGWVHKHIRNFGGDPTRITVMGESAGAALGHLLLMSPPAKGKISGAILISGNAFTDWTVMDRKLALRMTWRLAVMNFCPTNQGSLKMIECLRRRSPWLLEARQNLLHATEQSFLLFRPVIEPEISGAVITKPPADYYTQGLVPKVPIMVSENSNDADLLKILMTLSGTWPLVGRSVITFSPENFGYRGKVRNQGRTTKKIIDFYGGIDKMAGDKNLFFKAINDRRFTFGWRKALRLHSQIAPTFAYVLAYHSKRGIAGKLLLDPNDYGVPHAEDLFYVFNRTDVEPIRRTDPDFQLVKLFQSIFTNFASHGEPLYTSDDNINHKIIEPVSPPPSETFKMLVIDNEVKMDDIPWETNITKFWESLSIKEFPSYRN